MKKISTYISFLLLFCIVCGCSSTQYTINDSKAHNIRINTNDSSVIADSSIIRLITPYKSSLDSQMNVVVGYAEVDLIKKRPNGNLNNFIADVIRVETSKKIGEPIDFAFTNISGLRIPSIPKGNITKGKLFELMPFDNMIVAAKINGATLKQVLQKIASKGGEAISGFNLVISTHGKLIFATYNGIKVDFSKDYIIATNDFLFNGGDNYTMFNKGVIKMYPIAVPIRDMVINHIKKLSDTNTPINPKTDERITVQ